ncbi:MAG TPA: cyclic nucleotide-binding domain-containing protein [Polyangiaceae bacterium]|nr:cyclic nucleotide-binding domain-containing protein [Polyangiaceae bacterium]
MSKVEQRIRALRDEATRLVERGKPAQALLKYRELEELEPEEPDWVRRAADCCQRTGDKKQELECLLKAAQGYSLAGFVVKATAMCKRALALEPNNTAATTQLSLLHTARDEHASAARARQEANVNASIEKRPPVVKILPPVTQLPAPRIVTPIAVPLADVSLAAVSLAAVSLASIPPRAPLSAVSLVPLLPGSLRAELGSAVDGVYELVLAEGSAALAVPQGFDDARLEREQAELALNRSSLFESVAPATLKSLLEQVQWVHLEPGEVLFSEGSEADAMYVVALGEMVATKEGPSEIKLGTLGEGDFFGEIGILNDQPRQATLRAIQSTDLLRLDRELINLLIATEPGFLQVMLRFLRARLVMGLMLTSPLFSRLGAAQRAALSGQFRFLEIDPQTALIKQGTRADGLFVLLSGSARVENVAVAGHSGDLGRLHAGDLCGEISLLNHEPAHASVTSETRCFALFLPAQEFRELVMANPLMLEAVSEIAQQRQAELQAGLASEGHLDLI